MAGFVDARTRSLRAVTCQLAGLAMMTLVMASCHAAASVGIPADGGVTALHLLDAAGSAIAASAAGQPAGHVVPISTGPTVWESVLHYFVTTKLYRDNVPGLLSAMGVINTVIAFVYTTALSRVAAIKNRKRITFVFYVAWFALAAAVSAYVLNTSFDWPTGGVLNLGLVLWVLSFLLVLQLIASGARDSVRTRTSPDRGWKFASNFNEPTFGVPVIDQAIRRAVQAHRRITFPFLIINDPQSPGLAIVNGFVGAAYANRDAVVYLTFSRPYTTIRDQIERYVSAHVIRQVWIIDCYSSIYMPEHKSRGVPNVFFADARDPSDVYAKYSKAMKTASRQGYKSMRVVYETLSDFVKIADVDLVLHYLRRVVVLEEQRRIKSLYLYWDGVSQGGVDQKYLQWFFSTTISMKRPEGSFGTTFEFYRLFRDRVTIKADDQMIYDEDGLFQVSRARMDMLAEAMKRLHYRPKHYNFIADMEKAIRRKHLANFLLFMAAIDHNTHRGSAPYEGTVDGKHFHGSDLLYKLAEREKLRNPDSFFAKTFREIADSDVQRIFTTSEGRIPADIHGRAELFRSTARHLDDKYKNGEQEGDALTLLDSSHNRIGGTGGLAERLGEFPAFEDPIGKKTNLLIKLWMREEIFEPSDRKHVDTAIDHVVMTMAIRSGLIICLDRSASSALQAGQALDCYQVEVLRDVTRKAMALLAEKSGLHPDEIDDLIWSYGRKSLRRATPLDDPRQVRSDLDDALELHALPEFVAILNGIDAGAASNLKDTPIVRVPFTRYY